MGENMIDVKDFLRRTADRNGFLRERYEDAKVPGDPDGLAIMPFFGDWRSTFVLSSLLLKRYKEELKGSKYFILLSWPGFASLFPYVDEYWTVGEDQFKKLYSNTDSMENRSDQGVVHLRNLHES